MKLLLEEARPAAFDLPDELSLLYGGSIGFPERVLYANFVSSLDGVVALPGHAHSSGLISGRNEADRFVMGLLRAFADVVLIGAETFRSSPGSLWTPGYIFPDADPAFGELRRRLGRSPEPKLAIVTSSGELDLNHPALRAGALVFTTEQTAAGLRDELAAPSQVVALDQTAPLELTAVIDHLRGLGHDAILTEGGPTVIGRLLEAALVDELFLTVSPVLAGRSAEEYRPGFVEGVLLLPARGVWSSLLDVRSHEQHLFLRYALRQVSSA